MWEAETMGENENTETDNESELLQQQYLRALSSFEGIVLSQIDVKNKLGNRLNYSIRTGLIILSAIALSILVLLLTLSAQITRISDVVAEMNTHFTSISTKMNGIRDDMVTMEKRVTLMASLSKNTGTLAEQMGLIAGDMDAIDVTMGGTARHLNAVRGEVGNIASAIDRMNGEVLSMSAEMHRMAKPARSINKIFPFPFQ